MTSSKWSSTPPTCSGIRSESARQTLGLQRHYRGDPRGGPQQQPAHVLWREGPTEHVWADHVRASTGGRDPAWAESHGQWLRSGELTNSNSITAAELHPPSSCHPPDFLSKLVNVPFAAVFLSGKPFKNDKTSDSGPKYVETYSICQLMQVSICLQLLVWT